MKDITIHCGEVNSAAAFHEILADQLDFPQWYGRNLDALHDLLTAIREDTCLTLVNFAAADSFHRGFLRVFRDSEKENPHLHIHIV